MPIPIGCRATFAAYLQGRLGVRKGDRIAVMLPNLPAFPLAMLGIIRAGAVQVNVNPLYTPRELEHQLNDAGVEIIVIFSGVSATLAEIIGKTAVKHVISVGLGDGIGAELPSPPVDARLANVIAFSDALAKAAKLAFTPVALSGDDLLFLQYTGGTTGLSKGAALSHRNLVANTEQFKAFMPDALRPGEEVVVTALPLYHIFALMVNFITYFSIGAENWLVPNPRDMDGFIEVLRKARCTVFTGVNTLFGGLLDASQNRRSGFHQAARGDRRRRRGAADDFGEMEGADRQRHPRRLRPVGNLADPHAQSGDARPRSRRRSGLPLPSTDIKLLDDDDKDVRARRARRGLRQGPAGDEGLLAEAGSQCRSVHGRRLFPHRRHRRVRREGVPQDRRSQEGHDHRLGLQRLSRTRSRRSPRPAPASPNAPASAGRTRRPARRCGCSSPRRQARR